MGARSTYTFTSDPTPESAEDDYAHVYLHYGGESREECEQTMREFYEELTKLTDTRVSDPGYLAAKFVVWAASRSRYPKDAPELEFLSVGIMPERMDGADYGVVVCCGDINFGLPATYTAPDTQSADRSDFEPAPFGQSASA